MGQNSCVYYLSTFKIQWKNINSQAYFSLNVQVLPFVVNQLPKAAAGVADRPSILDTVKPDNNNNNNLVTNNVHIIVLIGKAIETLSLFLLNHALAHKRLQLLLSCCQLYLLNQLATIMHLSMSSPTYLRSDRGEEWWGFANTR